MPELVYWTELSSRVLFRTDPSRVMGQTRNQVAAAGAFDAQSAIDRLEAEMAEMRGDITELKQATTGITEIKQKMVTVDVLDTLMQKYLSIPTPPSGITHAEGAGNSSITQPDTRANPTLSVSMPVSAPI